MKPLTGEWVQKAEEDRRAAILAYEAEAQLPNIACFHAQQCAEKYLKAVLQEAEIHFRRTHDLVELLELAERLAPELLPSEAELGDLSRFAVDIRYPGRTAGPEQAARAVELMNQVRSVLRLKLGLVP